MYTHTNMQVYKTTLNRTSNTIRDTHKHHKSSSKQLDELASPSLWSQQLFDPQRTPFSKSSWLISRKHWKHSVMTKKNSRQTVWDWFFQNIYQLLPPCNQSNINHSHLLGCPAGARAATSVCQHVGDEKSRRQTETEGTLCRWPLQHLFLINIKPKKH